MGTTAPGRYTCTFLIAVCLIHQYGAMLQPSSYNNPPYGYQGQNSNTPQRGYPSTYGSGSRYPGAPPPSYQSNPSRYGSSSGGYPGGPPPPQGGYPGGPPPPQGGYPGGPPPPQGGYPGGPPPPQGGYPGGPPPPQGGYPGGPPPAQGGYQGGPQASQSGYTGVVPSSGYKGGPPPKGGYQPGAASQGSYQPPNAPPQNGYPNSQPGGGPPQPDYHHRASQNGPALSSYQSAQPSGGYPGPQPPRGFPSPTYQRGPPQRAYPGESPRGYAPRNQPPSRGYPQRYPRNRYPGQVQYFTAPPPDPSGGVQIPLRTLYNPRGPTSRQPFVPMPSTTTTPLPTSSTTTTGLPTTVAGEIEPPEYEGVTGTGGTTTSTTPTPTTTTASITTTTPPPTRPWVQHQRQPAQQNQYRGGPPQTQQGYRNQWQPPAPILSHQNDRYNSQWTRRLSRWTLPRTFRNRPFTPQIAPSYHAYQQRQIPMTKPDRQPSTSARTTSNSLPKRPALTRGQTQVQRPIQVNSRPVSSSRRGGVRSITRNGTPGSYTILNNQQHTVRKLPPPQRKNTRPRTNDNTHKLVLMLLSQQSGAAGSSRHSPGFNARPANSRYPPQQQQQHYQRQAYPPPGQQAQRYPPAGYQPLPRPQPQPQPPPRRGYPEQPPQPSYQRYAPQAQTYQQPARQYPPPRRPYEPYKPRQTFREPHYPQQMTYESRAARMPVPRPQPNPRQSPPLPPPPAAAAAAAAAKSVRKEVRFFLPHHLIPKPPATTTTPLPKAQPRPVAQPRNPPPPPKQQHYVGNAGLGRYGQKQYKWFPYEQRWSPHNTRGKRSVQRSDRVGPEGSQPAPGATAHDIPGPVDGLSSMFEGTVGEHSEHSTDRRIYDSPAVTQFQLKTLRTKSPGVNSTSSSGSPVPDEPSLSRSNFGQATSASEVSVGRPKIRRGQTDLLSIPSMRVVERVEIQHHKSSPASLTGVDGALSSEYGKGKPLGSPHSSVPLKSLSEHNINWDRLVTRNIARKGPHGRNEGTIVLPVA